MALQINSIRALTKLSRSPSDKYFVLAYFLPEKPHTHPVEGEVFSYAMALRSFNNEREAVAYRDFAEQATKHNSIFVVDAMSWASLSTRNLPYRFRCSPETLEKDIVDFHKRLREQEKIRNKLSKDFEAKLQLESDSTTLPYYARMLYDGVKVAERIEALEKELRVMHEVFNEKKGAVQAHHKQYPEHDNDITEYFAENLGDLRAGLAEGYLKKWTTEEEETTDFDHHTVDGDGKLTVRSASGNSS